MARTLDTWPLLVAGVVGLMAIPPSLPQVTAAAVLVGFSPLAIIGARLVGRYRAGAVCTAAVLRVRGGLPGVRTRS